MPEPEDMEQDESHVPGWYKIIPRLVERKRIELELFCALNWNRRPGERLVWWNK